MKPGNRSSDGHGANSCSDIRWGIRERYTASASFPPPWKEAFSMERSRRGTEKTFRSGGIK